MSAPSPAGWYPDPLGRHDHRWYNGHTWTSDVADGGHRFVDPLGISPGPLPAAQQPRNGLATAAMVLGILAVLVAWIPFVVVFGVIMGVLALVFGVVGLRRASESGTGKGFAIAGVVTGGASLVVAVLGVALTIVVWNEVVDFAEPGPFDVADVECVAEGRNVTVTGALTNESTRERDYTVFVTVDERTDVLTVDDLEAGGTARWEAGIRAPFPDPDCDPDVDVQGPFPFGIEVDAIDD